MSDKNHPMDVTGPSLEEAIDKGLEQLGLTRNDVIIEIVEEGSKGVLGIGARDAVVRLTPLHVPSAPPPARGQPSAPAAASKPAQKPAPAEASAQFTPDDEQALAPSASPEELEEEATVGSEILEELLGKMGIKASLKARKVDGGEASWLLDIQGQDLGMLIGRRGETLDALQYLTRLMVNHRLQRRSSLSLDVESYKTRREVSLRRLAERMAAQAIELGRTVTLEPMPANERRIIHMALQEDKSVRTESVGEGDRRKVTIIPVNPRR